MTSYRDRIAEITARVLARVDDPAYRARVEALERESAADADNQIAWGRRWLGIPRAFWTLLDHPEETEALAATRAFLAGPKKILLLAGAVGRGKSVAAAWAVDQTRGRFVDAADIVQASVYDASHWRGLFLHGLLAIDELGAEALDQAGWGVAKLYDLVNGRLSEDRRTILCTNLAPREFIARYPDQRLRDRLKAYGAFHVAKGESLRRGAQ